MALPRRAIINLFSLNPGDRFYFCNDSTKTVWQVKERIVKRAYKGIWKRFVTCTNDLKVEQTFYGGRSIVFLRNVNNQHK